MDIVPSSCGVLVTWCSVSFLDWIGLWDWVNVPPRRIYTVAAFSPLPSHPCRQSPVCQSDKCTTGLMCQQNVFLIKILGYFVVHGTFGPG